MKKELIKFWFEFDIKIAFDFPPGIGIGCGVTAFDYEDAIKIMDEKVFHSTRRPLFKKEIVDISINKLDTGHVIPNMRDSADRGIWFPLGYE